MTRGAPVDRTLWWLIVASTGLSVGHHIDHVLRDATGWPFPGHGVNPFTYSLVVYVIIAVLVILTLRRVAGPGSWAAFTGVGVAFVAAVHLGPAADDTVAMVRDGYAGQVPGVIAVGLLGLQLLVLATTCVYATGRWRASRTLHMR